MNMRAPLRHILVALLLCTVASFANAISPVVHRAVRLDLQTRERSLLLPNGDYAGAAYQKALRQRALMVKTIPGAVVSNASISWAELGPDNVGGRINSLWVDPKKAAHILAASASGGVW